MSFFGDLFSAFSSKPAEKAAQDQIAALNAGKSSATSDLDTGLASATPLYGQAYQPFSTLYTKALPGVDAYADATGANGAAGLARAKANFQADPGYSGGLTTGVDQVMRTAAARGDLGGGNTSTDLVKFASDYDNNKYNQYVSGLAPWLSAGNSAAAGGAGVLGSEAGADLGVAGQRAGIDTSTAQGVGSAQAQADMAPYQASNNFWSALTGAAGLGLKAAGVGGFGAPKLSLAPSGGSSGALNIGGYAMPTVGYNPNA